MLPVSGVVDSSPAQLTVHVAPAVPQSIGAAIVLLRQSVDKNPDALDMVARHLGTAVVADAAATVGALLEDASEAVLALLERQDCCQVCVNALCCILRVGGDRARQLCCIKAVSLFVAFKHSASLGAQSNKRRKKKVTIISSTDDEDTNESAAPSLWAHILVPLVDAVRLCCWDIEAPTNLAVAATDCFLALSQPLYDHCADYIGGTLLQLSKWYARSTSSLLVCCALDAMVLYSIHRDRTQWLLCVPLLLWNQPAPRKSQLAALQKVSFRNANTMARLCIALGRLGRPARLKWYNGHSNLRAELLQNVRVCPPCAMALVCDLEPELAAPVVAKVLLYDFLVVQRVPLTEAFNVRSLLWWYRSEAMMLSLLNETISVANCIWATSLLLQEYPDKLISFIDACAQWRKLDSKFLAVDELRKSVSATFLSRAREIALHVIQLQKKNDGNGKQSLNILRVWSDLDCGQCWSAMLSVSCGMSDVTPSVWALIRQLALEYEDQLKSIAEALIGAVMEHPTDATLVKLVSSMSEILSRHARDIVMPLLCRKMDVQAQLTQELLDDPNSVAAVRDLLFLRLAPLLVLRTLSAPSMMQDESEECTIAPLLLARMVGLYEFDQVRRLAAEAMSKLNPLHSLPLTMAAFDGVAHELHTEQGLVCAKAVLFSWCGSLVGVAATVAARQLSPRMMTIVRAVILAPMVADQDASLLHTAVVEFVALCLRENVDDCHGRFLSGVFSEPLSVPLCILGGAVLIRVFQREVEHSVTIPLAQKALEPLVNVASSLPITARAPILNALFLVLFLLRHVSLPQLASPLVVLGVESAKNTRLPEEERKVGLKLLGVLLAVDGLFEGDGAPLLFVIGATLEEVAREGNAVSSLATQLRSVMEK
jgi:hypothetical protein